jgi:hypothetical protein
MNATKSAAATFTRSNYLLTVTTSGTGSGTVTSAPAGISNCSGTCAASYTSGTLVTLTAAAGSHSSFVGWSGACSGGGACAVTVNAAKSVTAAFVMPTVAGQCKNDGWMNFGFPNQGQCIQFVNTGK